MRTPLRWLINGGLTLLLGWLILLLVVVDVIPPIVWLELTAYVLTVIGFITGIIGVIMFARIGRRE